MRISRSLTIVAATALALAAGCSPTAESPAADAPAADAPVVAQAVPSVVSDNGGIALGASGIAGDAIDPDLPRVDIYFDYMCPICGQFEEIHSPELDEMREAGLITVYYHPVSILNRFSNGTKYSSRAVQAVATVAEYAPAQFNAYSIALFANQPAEGTDGLTDEQLVEIAALVGVPEDVQQKILVGEFATWVEDATEAASVAGMRGTPWILLDGRQFVEWGEPGALRASLGLDAA